MGLLAFLGPLGWLVDPIAKVAREIGKTIVAKENAQTEQERIAADERLGMLNAKRDVLIAEQTNPITRIIRPLFALPFVLYVWKVIVWDNLLGWGVTDSLSADMTNLMMIIVGAYFLDRTVQRLKR